MGVAVSSSHIVSAAPSSSGARLLTLPLLQRGVPSTGCSSSRTAPVWVPCGVTSPGQKTCSSTGFPQGHSLLHMQPPALVWGRPRAAGGYLLHRGPPWAAGGQPASPWSSPWAAGESLLRCLEHLLPSFTDLGVCRAVSLTCSHSSLRLPFLSVPETFFPS